MQKFISLSDSVRGAVAEMLDDEAMACIHTQNGLIYLISALAHYTEEGRSLFPEIFIFDDLKSILSMMPNSENVPIGTGPRNPETMTLALRKCAPLASFGWSIYIERGADDFRYGLIRAGESLVALGMADILVDKGQPEMPVLRLHQVGTRVIEVTGVRQHSLVIHFGATRASESSPIPTIRSFAATIVRDTSLHVKEQAAAFYADILTDILHAGHGTLAAVVSRRSKCLPSRLGDGIHLSKYIDACGKISSLLAQRDSLSNMELLSCKAIITGMFMSDGITILASDGSVRAYNVFMKHPNKRGAEVPRGGARHRTFSVLSSMTGPSKTLRSCFILSQDGKAELKGGSSNG